MSTPRRRLVRPPTTAQELDPNRTRRLQRLRARLEKERAALVRWMVRLRRAFHAMERLQRSAARVERQITTLEAS